MRRFFVGVALYTLAAVTPLAAWGGDREIAEEIYSNLKGQQSAGVLQGFTLDLGVVEGRVVFKGQVSSEAQRDAVLNAAADIDGVTEVVDEIVVVQAAKPTPVKIDEETGAIQGPFSLSQALVDQAPKAEPVALAGATGDSVTYDDASVKADVMSALGSAQRAGELRGFLVKVSVVEGDVRLVGKARTEEVKSSIIEMARRIPGVRGVTDEITILTAAPAPAAVQPVSVPAQQVRHLQPVEVQNISGYISENAAGPVATATPVRFEYAGQAVEESPAVVGDAYAAPAQPQMAPVPMTPVPMAYGAPHYGNPNMPNYAWPGYAAYPNYAALTYPQQYSPTAWPYIGPFYPYPQVPLGWRKVSLEWDDGWWFLDFTDK